LSAWVEKVFDTYIQPNTIIKRAERQQKKNWSNDHKKTEQNSEIEVKNDNRKRSLPDLPRLAGTITSSELSERRERRGDGGLKNEKRNGCLYRSAGLG